MKYIPILTIIGFFTTVYSKNVFDIKDNLRPLRGRGRSHILPIVQHPLFQDPSERRNEGLNKIYVPDGEEPRKGPNLLISSISTNKEISVFAKYVRDNVKVSSRFNSKKTQSIVFAPTDSGIFSLPLKPWQYPMAVDETKSEKEKDEIITSNLNDFVLSHTIDGEFAFDVLGDAEKGVQFVSENGKNIKLVNDHGEYYATAVKNGHDQEWLKVQNVITADNGAILVISKPLSLPTY